MIEARAGLRRTRETLSNFTPFLKTRRKGLLFALLVLLLETGTLIRLACSWRVQAGQEAVISAAFYGTEGGAALKNVGGSFYDFTAERFRGTARETLASPPDEWGGRAAAEWAVRLAGGMRFAPEAEWLVDVARVLDQIYGR